MVRQGKELCCLEQHGLVRHGMARILALWDEVWDGKEGEEKQGVARWCKAGIMAW